MKARIGKGQPTCAELSLLLGVKVNEIVTNPDGTVQLGIDATSLTAGQKTALEKRFGVEVTVV